MSDLLASVGKEVHQPQPSALSITNATEYGRVYTAAETAALGALCREHGLRFHVDGARFANAVVSTGASPADLTWRAGVDALSFGFTKNGGLSAEALILFDPALAETVHYRRKRAGHLLSKGRYLAAQLLAMLEGDVWLRNARAANDAAARLAEAAGPQRLLHPVEANELFLRVSAGRGRVAPRPGLRLLRLGARARRGSSPPGTAIPAHVEALAAAIHAL